MYNKTGLLTKRALDKMSFRNSMDRNLNNTSLRKIYLEDVINDIIEYRELLIGMDEFIGLGDKRIKSVQSATLKYHKHIGRGGTKVVSCFNDLIGIRLYPEKYPENIPEYFRKVDMRNGKRTDDGYRAIHLYYQKDRYHYPIEIQVWAGADINFNTWSHVNLYKYSMDNRVGVKLRQLYDAGKIQSQDDFNNALKSIMQYIERRGM